MFNSTTYGMSGEFDTRSDTGLKCALRHARGPGRANAEHVRQGMAWVFEKYARPDSPLYTIQNEANARSLVICPLRMFDRSLPSPRNIGCQFMASFRMRQSTCLPTCQT